MEDGDADSSPCDFLAIHFPAEKTSFMSLSLHDHPFDTALHSECLSICNFMTHKKKDSSPTPTQVKTLVQLLLGQFEN